MKILAEDKFAQMKNAADNYHKLLDAMVAANPELKKEDIKVEDIVGDIQGNTEETEEPEPETVTVEQLQQTIAQQNQTIQQLSDKVTTLLSSSPAGSANGGAPAGEPTAENETKKDGYQKLFGANLQETGKNLKAAGLL